MNAGVHSFYICWKMRYFIHSYIQIIQHNKCFLNKYLIIENQVQEEETM